MITYVDFERICLEEGVGERFIRRLWDAREGIVTRTGQDPALAVDERGFRQALRILMERWPHLLKEPS